MVKRQLSILQISSADIAGGAERVAWNLFEGFRKRGHLSALAVGHKRSEDRDVLQIPNNEARGRLFRLLSGTAKENARANANFARLASKLIEPRRTFDQQRGLEDFHFPGIWQLPQLLDQFPDIVHCHNLHGDYFDLRALPWLSKQAPLVLTLHDSWLLSGHCAHSFDCERWQLGCGECPDLTIYPAVRRDATAYNWRRKQRIYEQSRIYLSTPCRWLMDRVDRSALAGAVVERRIIPYGIDLNIFKPADKKSVRSTLAIPSDAIVLLFTANRIRQNIWKDYSTMEAAIAQVARKLSDQELIFIALGEDAPAQKSGSTETRFVSFEKDPARVALYYQAADIYLHAARADTFPNTVLEALACGTPVVGTTVGGIPEQVDEGLTGFLVPPGDHVAMASRILDIIQDDALRMRMSHLASIAARERFDLERQVNDHLSWYEEIIDRRNTAGV